MPFSYSGNPASSAKDQVRFLIGDTDKCDVLLQDGEINWLLTQYNNTPMNAAIRACETIISKFSRQADEAVGQVKISFSQRAKSYQTTLTILRSRLAMEDCRPYAGGISIADKMIVAMNTDRVRPDFTRHMMENDLIAPWTSQGDYGLWATILGE
jgi:hypothetical protein